ncbi:MAG: winged helix-turn-helix domain-containing protein [Acidobacteriota bacterium]
MQRENLEIYEFGRFRLDVGERRLARRDGSVSGSLPEKAFLTLVHLVRNSGMLVTKDELLTAVWPDAIVEENNLGKAVHAIRHVLGETNQTFIETIPKHGYRFVADVSRVEKIEDAKSRMLQGTRAASFGRSPAYDLYLHGKVKAASVKREETEAAIKLLEEAVAVDPNFAEAYAQLARARIRMAFNFSEEADRKAFLEDAEVAIEEALTLKPDLAEGHFARGLIIWTHNNRFPHEQAIQAYKRSLRSDPNADETHHQLSMIYGHIGLMDEALHSVRKAIEINPNNTMARFRVSNYLAWQAKADEALAVLKTVPRDVSPLLVERVRAETLIQAGRVDEAQNIVDDYLAEHPGDSGGSFTSVKALLLARSGRRVESENAIARAAQIGKGYGHFHHTAYNIASAHAAMNNPDEAVAWLEAAIDDGFPNYTYIKLDPNLDNMRKHPRFIGLLSELRQQWQHFKRLA